MDIQLSDTPQHHPDCCLGLSKLLLEILRDLLPEPPEYGLSVGSGSGLLEALILQRHSTKKTYGVEVSDSVNKYLPQELMRVVAGTRDLCEAAAEASAWMFVYPREPQLVARYLESFGEGCVNRIVWLGPHADLADYEPIFSTLAGWRKMWWVAGLGIAPYETMAVVEREGSDSFLSRIGAQP